MLFDSLFRINRETGISLKHINLGGGFPVNYLRDDANAADIEPEKAALFSSEFDAADAIGQAWSAIRKSPRLPIRANCLPT